MGGLSEGGINSFATAYMSQSNLNTLFGSGLSTALGSINNGHYAAPTSVSYSIKGVFNMCGGMFGLSTHTVPQVIKAGDPPLIAFHGVLDPTVPFDVAEKDFCTDAETQCSIPYTPPSGQVKFFGSKAMYERLSTP